MRVAVLNIAHRCPSPSRERDRLRVGVVLPPSNRERLLCRGVGETTQIRGFVPERAVLDAVEKVGLPRPGLPEQDSADGVQSP